MKARKARGNFLLLLTAMIWGSSFVAQSAGADLISPAFFNGTRMLLGSLLVTLCDLLGRVLFAPFELPVGILLSLLGGPFFLWLLFRQRGGRRL